MQIIPSLYDHLIVNLLCSICYCIDVIYVYTKPKLQNSCFILEDYINLMMMKFGIQLRLQAWELIILTLVLSMLMISGHSKLRSTALSGVPFLASIYARRRQSRECFITPLLQ